MLQLLIQALSRRSSASLTALLGALLLASCAGGGARAERITLRNFSTDRGQRDFELVAKSSGDELAYYSTARANASRKYLQDELMEALSDHLMKSGLRNHAQPGPAPTRPDSRGLMSGAFEWVVDGQTMHWTKGRSGGTSAAAELVEEHEQFWGCSQMFLEVWNAEPAYQSIKNEGGRDLFEDERRRLFEHRQRQSRQGRSS